MVVEGGVEVGMEGRRGGVDDVFLGGGLMMDV